MQPKKLRLARVLRFLRLVDFTAAIRDGTVHNHSMGIVRCLSKTCFTNEAKHLKMSFFTALMRNSEQRCVLEWIETTRLNV